MPIETKIDGDPEGVRSAGAWLRANFSGGVHDCVSAIYQASGNSESTWTGSAGEGYRTKMSASARKGDDMAAAADHTGQSFELFADDLQTARVGMDRANQIALDGGLVVTDTQILDPGPAPTTPAALPADGSATPQMVQGYNDAVAAGESHSRKVAAFTAASEEASRARRVITEGIGEFRSRVTKEVIEKRWFIAADAANGAVGAAAATRAQSLLNRANVLMDQRKLFDEIYQRTPGGTAASRAEITRIQQAFDDADAATRQSGSIARRFGARLPVIGLGVAAAGVAYDIDQGKPVGKAVASGVGGVLGGAAGGAALGSFLGPPGMLVGGVVGGVIGGVGTEWAYDLLPDNVTDGFENGLKELGGDVKDAWNSIF